jgi:hypothetical protein
MASDCVGHQVWLSIAASAVPSEEIFRQSMAVIQQVDSGKEVRLLLMSRSKTSDDL